MAAKKALTYEAIEQEILICLRDFLEGTTIDKRNTEVDQNAVLTISQALAAFNGARLGPNGLRP